MTHYEKLTGEPFISTAIYPNRIKDKEKLEKLFNLNEDGGTNCFFSKKYCMFDGYTRIVYGDHGPYIEFIKDNASKLHPIWSISRQGIGYYDILYPDDASGIKVYYQRITVKNLPNPPKGKMSFNGNRKEGYADYRISRFYISPYEKNLRIFKDQKEWLNDTMKQIFDW